MKKGESRGVKGEGVPKVIFHEGVVMVMKNNNWGETDLI